MNYLPMAVQFSTISFKTECTLNLGLNVMGVMLS